jgi:hypothetical protein
MNECTVRALKDKILIHNRGDAENAKASKFGNLSLRNSSPMLLCSLFIAMWLQPVAII